MENDEIAPAAKKQVSEKVLANLAKAQARRKELHEQKKAEKAADKEKSKTQRKIDRLKKQLVQLLPVEYEAPDSDLESAEQKGVPVIEEEMAVPQEVVVKKVKAPPPVEKAPVVKTNPKPVRERPIPAPPPPPKPLVQYF